VLSAEYSEEARKVYDALEWEEVLKRAVTDSKGKQHDTINEVEKGRSLFTEKPSGPLLGLIMMSH
jgi:hypothetical protein